MLHKIDALDTQMHGGDATADVGAPLLQHQTTSLRQNENHVIATLASPRTQIECSRLRHRAPLWICGRNSTVPDCRSGILHPL